MDRCKACGKKVISVNSFMGTPVCKKCSKEINMQGWIDRNFATIDSLYELKTTALDNAKLLKMSDSFIEEIQAFFFEYEKKGFFATIPV